jgi:hypothetical protein
MGHSRGAAFRSDPREPLRLQTTLGADAQRVRLTPQNITGYEVANNGVEEVLFGINQYVLDCTERERTFFERDRRLLIDTTRVDTGGYDIPAIVFL